MPPISGSTSTADGVKLRMVSSCNGCRALRKGCSDDCAIRPCLQWIKSPEAQGKATVFLAKFYGRAGLLNLIAAAPGDADRRQAVFRSLLYEACGRIVNPVYGAVGLLWSGEWEKCVDAVEAVLRGELALVAPVDAAVLDGDRDPAVQVVDAAASSEAKADAAPLPRGARPGKGRPPAAYDIRHIAKHSDAAVAADLLRFARAGRTGFKRAAGSSSSNSSRAKLPEGKAKLLKGKGKGKASSNNVRAPPSPPLGQQQEAEELEPVPMVMELEHDGGHDHHLKGKASKENTDVQAASQVIQAKAEPPAGMQVLVADQEEEEVGLELTLGF